MVVINLWLLGALFWRGKLEYDTLKIYGAYWAMTNHIVGEDLGQKGRDKGINFLFEQEIPLL